MYMTYSWMKRLFEWSWDNKFDGKPIDQEAWRYNQETDEDLNKWEWDEYEEPANYKEEI